MGGKCVHKLSGASGYESAFLSNTMSQGIHHWKFKILGGHKSASNRIFGIWNVETMTVTMSDVLSTYFMDKHVVKSHDDAYSKAFGSNVGEGDIVEMYLDLGKQRLYFKLNGALIGKPIGIKQGEYRAVVSFYCANDRIKLLGYRKN